MNKEDFLNLLEQAKEDEYGNLYVLSEYNKVYFGTITTVCEDILEMADRKDHEVYDRHFWNDDTLECKIVTTQNIEKNEDKYFIPKRIEKLRDNLIKSTDRCIDTTFMDKIDEIIDVLNKYEYFIETNKLDKRE